jgi:hypothetical protein
MAPKRPRHSDSGLGTIEKDTLLVSLKELLSALGKGEDEYPRGKLLEMVQNLCNKFEGTTGNQVRDSVFGELLTRMILSSAYDTCDPLLSGQTYC